MATKTLVVDTSVIVKWLNRDNEELIAEADKILADAQQNNVSLIAPELAKYEVGNVLLRGKNLSLTQAKVVLTLFYKLPLVFIEDTEVLAKEGYRIAAEVAITYYDASFLALAKQYNATLITDNFKHQGKSKTVQVLPLKDYS